MKIDSASKSFLISVLVTLVFLVLVGALLSLTAKKSEPLPKGRENPWKFLVIESR